MADSICVKCGNAEFEAREVSPSGTERTLLYVQCSSCGGVVGVLDATDIGEMIRKQNTAFKQIAQQFGMRLDLE